MFFGAEEVVCSDHGKPLNISLRRDTKEIGIDDSEFVELAYAETGSASFNCPEGCYFHVDLYFDTEEAKQNDRCNNHKAKKPDWPGKKTMAEDGTKHGPGKGFTLGVMIGIFLSGFLYLLIVSAL